MPKIYEKNRKGLKALLRDAKRGAVFYGVVETSGHCFVPSQMADRWKVTHMHPLLGGAMCGSMTLEDILYRHGPLSDTPDPNLHGMWEPLPQVGGPVDSRTRHVLDEAEIRGLEKRSAEATEERTQRSMW